MYSKSRKKHYSSSKRSRHKSRHKNRYKSKKKYKNKSIELLNIKRSPLYEKKMRATFRRRDRIIHTDFGARGMSDYTKHKDKDRRSRYMKRHKKDLRTNDPTRAGFLSMFILWNKPTLKSSILDYKKRLDIYNSTGIFPKKIV